jgi:hypothetical protein
MATAGRSNRSRPHGCESLHESPAAAARLRRWKLAFEPAIRISRVYAWRSATGLPNCG